MSDRPKLPFIEIIGWQGLYTKSNPEVLKESQLRTAQNCDFFEEYGSVAKIKGSSRVLASIYTETSVVKPISWIGFHKAPDLDGTIHRHVLAATGTRLSRVESGGTLTTLATGRLSGRVHTSARLGRFSFISNQNPDLTGDGDKLVKYDGCVISNWGVTPPGSQEIIRESFNDSSVWTPTNVTLSNEATVTWDGAATGLDKTSTSNRTFDIQKNVSFYVQINQAGIRDTRSSLLSPSNRVSFFTFIPCGKLTASDQDTGGFFSTRDEALTVWVSPNASTVDENNWKFYFSIGDLVEGWNKLSLDFRLGHEPNFSQNGHFYPEKQRIRNMKFQFNLQGATTQMTGLKIDKLVNFDQGTPVAAPTGSGSLTGAYQYRVSFVSKYGFISNAGPASTSITASSAARILLTKIPISTDPQVIKRRIYRTVANGSVYLFLAEIADNVTTTYTDTTADGSLGNETPPLAGDFSLDNSPPARGGIVARWKRTVFVAGDPQNPESLFFSDDDEPESFPLVNEYVLDGKITGMYETYSNLVIETENGKYQLIGDNPDFSLSKIIEGIGCVGRRACGPARRTGYTVDRDGMRTYDGSDTVKISEPIRDKYDTDIDKVNIELMHTVHSKRRNTIIQWNPDDTAVSLTTPYPTYESAFVWQYVIDELNQGQWSTLSLGNSVNILDAEEIEDSNGDFRIYAGAADGMIYELLNSSSKNFVNANGTATAIDTIIQTTYIRPGEAGAPTEGASGRAEPRWMEIRAVGDASTWTVTVDTADGPLESAPRDTKTLSMAFESGDSIMRYAIPAITPANYVRFKFQNAQLGVSSRILAARCLFHVRPFEGEKTT